MPRQTGTVSRVIADKGFGFIKGLGGKELFFHRSAITSGGDFESLREGQPVSFDEGKGAKGPRAENIELTN
jgi:CspA family cold shock protein